MKGNDTVNLCVETRRLLCADPRSDCDIGRALSVPAPWLSMFRNELIKNPGANRIQILYEYLSGEVLLDG